MLINVSTSILRGNGFKSENNITLEVSLFRAMLPFYTMIKATFEKSPLHNFMKRRQHLDSRAQLSTNPNYLLLIKNTSTL